MDKRLVFIEKRLVESGAGKLPAAVFVKHFHLRIQQGEFRPERIPHNVELDHAAIRIQAVGSDISDRSRGETEVHHRSVLHIVLFARLHDSEVGANVE